MYVRNLSPSLSSLASSIATTEERSLRDVSRGRNLHAKTLSCYRAGASLALGPACQAAARQQLRSGPRVHPARDQVDSSQRWAGGTLAATPKTIPCPGSPATAAPASSLSTSPTLSDSDEPTAGGRGHQVQGLRCQAELPVTTRALITRAPRGLGGTRGRFFYYFFKPAGAGHREGGWDVPVFIFHPERKQVA